MLAHPNIVRVYEVLETERFLYFVQELCEGGDLVQLINARGRLSERETRHFMRQLLAAVDHMHRAGILHRCVASPRSRSTCTTHLHTHVHKHAVLAGT